MYVDATELEKSFFDLLYRDSNQQLETEVNDFEKTLSKTNASTEDAGQYLPRKEASRVDGYTKMQACGSDFAYNLI